MRDIYLETNRFYTIPSFKEYHLAKTAHINANHPQYDTKQTNEKWNLLITELMNSLEQKHIPNGMWALDFKNRLASFKTRRETTPPSPTNLSLEKLVNYFEEFNFLYRTTNPCYKLTDAAKKDLLQSISEGMGVCETGLNGRLYTALQVHQKETDWIQNELVKARCVTLGLLHTAYGVGSGDNHNVHTYNVLVQLANGAQLGIPQKEEVVDAYASIVNFQAVQAFFNAQYPTMFASYENNIEDCLTNHYLSELANTLGIDNVAWTHHTITMNYQQIRDINLSIQAYFQEEIDLYKIGDDDDNNDENYVLKPKQEVAKEIKSLVRKKLIADRYLISLDQIVEDPSLHQQVRLKNGMVLDDLISLYRALKNHEPQQILDSLEQNPLMLLRYPELISKICSNSAILSAIPRWLRCDSRFMDASMTALDQLLCEAINENDEEAIENLTQAVLYLIRSEYGYLGQLSQPVFANRLVAEKLIKKNNLLLGFRDTALQADFAQDEEDDRSSAHSCIYQKLPQDFIGRYDVFFKKGQFYHEIMTDFLKVQAIAELLSPKKISISTFLEHVNYLSPDQVLAVIRYRQEKQQPPLPFFDDHRDLEKFIQEIEIQLEDTDWSKSYLSIKRRACEKEDFKFMDPWAKKNVVTFLAKTDGWFAGFNQYQVYQTSYERLWTTLMDMAGVLLKLVVPIVTIGMTIANITWLFVPNIALMSAFISQFSGYIIPIILAAISISLSIDLTTLLKLYIDASQIPLVMNILDNIILGIFLGAISFALIYIIMDQSKDIFKTIIDNMGSFTIFLDVISRAFSHFTKKNPCHDDTLEDTCENIVIRLDGINEASAQGKAEVLRELLTQIKTDEEGTFKERLCKKYPINYQGQTHQVSFQETASIRRGHHCAFKLSERPGGMGFFSRRTTTEALLETVEPSLSLAL